MQRATPRVFQCAARTVPISRSVPVLRKLLYVLLDALGASQRPSIISRSLQALPNPPRIIQDMLETSGSEHLMIHAPLSVSRCTSQTPRSLPALLNPPRIIPEIQKTSSSVHQIIHAPLAASRRPALIPRSLLALPHTSRIACCCFESCFGFSLSLSERTISRLKARLVHH